MLIAYAWSGPDWLSLNRQLSLLRRGLGKPQVTGFQSFITLTLNFLRVSNRNKNEMRVCSRHDTETPPPATKLILKKHPCNLEPLHLDKKATARTQHRFMFLGATAMLAFIVYGLQSARSKLIIANQSIIQTQFQKIEQFSLFL